MSRLTQIAPDTATGKTKELLDAVKSKLGLVPDQIRDSRQGTAADGKTDALLHFARKLVETRGQVSDGDVDAVRQAGLTDGEIAEAVAGVALNIFTNYFNHVAATDIDFPKVDALPATRS